MRCQWYPYHGFVLELGALCGVCDHLEILHVPSIKGCMACYLVECERIGGWVKI